MSDDDDQVTEAENEETAAEASEEVEESDAEAEQAQEDEAPSDEQASAEEDSEGSSADGETSEDDDGSDEDEDSEGDDGSDDETDHNEQDEDSEDGDATDAEAIAAEDERRQTGRKGVKLNRLIASKILDGDSTRECYLHLVDISDGGLRVNSDDPFPEGRTFSIEVGLAAFGNELATKQPRQNFPVRLIWSKSLVGGMVVSGLAFEELDEKGQEVVAAIMEGASPQGRRMHFRLNRVLGVELGGEAGERWLYPLTLDLSVEGMRICLNESLEVGTRFPLKIFLEFDLPTVQTDADVMWQEVMPSGRVQVGLKFENMNDRDATAIKTYIDQCLQQDESYRKG